MREALDPGIDPVLGDETVAEDEAGRSRGANRCRFEPLDADARLLRRRNDGRLIDPSRQPGQHVESRRRSDRPDVRQVSLERIEHPVTTRPIHHPEPPQVTVEFTLGDEVGERQLVDRRRAEVGDLLGARDRVGQRLGDEQPAEPKTRSERLAGTPRVDDVGGRQPLDGTDRFAVVAELGVVVVLDDHPVASFRPRDEGVPPLG